MVLVYALFTAFLGQNGVYARRHLEAERQQLLENQKALEHAYDDFLRTKDRLTYDQDALSVYARQLNYGRENESYLRIMGLGIAINAATPAGQVLYATDPVFISDRTIKIISMLFGLAVLAFFLVSDFLSEKILGRD
jgi:hypothetical protein